MVQKHVSAQLALEVSSRIRGLSSTASDRLDASRQDWWRTWFRFCIYPVYFLRRTDDKVKIMTQRWRAKYGDIGPQIYDGHNADIKKLIPSEQLLVYDVREGWDPLCKFLGVPVPDEPYPNLNDTQAMRAIYIGQMAFGLSYWAMYAGAVGGLTYLAIHPETAKNIFDTVITWCSHVASRMRAT